MTGKAAGPNRWGPASFRRLWAGQSVSVLGDQITLLALPTVAIVVLHVSALQVGLLGAAAFAPYPVLGFIAGAWVDRLSRRRVMIAADAARFLAIASVPLAAVLGAVSMPQLYLVALTTGTAAVFFDSAYQAYLPALVSRDQIQTANSRLATSETTAQVAGPSLAGWLAQAVGASTAMAGDAASYLASLVSLLSIRTPEDRPQRHRGSLLPDIRAGLRVVFGTRLLRSLTLTTTAGNLGRGMALELFLLYAYRALHMSPGLAGTVLAAGSAGALLGALACRRITERLGIGDTLILAGIVKGLPWLAAPLALLGGAIPIMMTIIALSSFFIPVWNVNTLSLRQSMVPAELHGRVAATVRTVSWGAIPVSALAGGVLAQLGVNAFGNRIGLAAVLALGGAIWLASSLLLPVRELRRIATIADVVGIAEPTLRRQRTARRGNGGVLSPKKATDVSRLRHQRLLIGGCRRRVRTVRGSPPASEAPDRRCPAADERERPEQPVDRHYHGTDLARPEPRAEQASRKIMANNAGAAARRKDRAAST